MLSQDKTGYKKSKKQKKNLLLRKRCLQSIQSKKEYCKM